MPDPPARGATFLAYATLACGLAAWLFALSLGPHEAARRLIELPLLLDYDVYRDQLLRFSSTATSISSRWYYPPFAAVLLWPLRSPEPYALITFCLVQFALLAALCRECCLVLAPLPRAPRWAAAIGFSLICYPIAACLAYGQVALLITVLSLRTLTSRTQSRAWLGAAVAFKLYPLLYALGYAIRLELKPLLRLAAWVVLLGLVIPLLWLGPATTSQLFDVALSVALRSRGPRFDMDQTLDACLTRLFYSSSVFAPEPHGLLLSLPLPLVLALAQLASVAVLAYALWRTRHVPAHDPLAVAAVLLATTLLIKPGWPHYSVVLPYAQGVLLARAQGKRELVLCAFSVLASALPFLALCIPGALDVLQTWGVLTLSGLCVLVGVCERAADCQCLGKSTA